MESFKNRLIESFVNEKAEVYDVETEEKYNKLMNSKLEKIMKGSTPTQKERIEAATKVYDGKEFTNNGVNYKLTVDKNAKNEGDVIKVVASKGSQKQERTISPANVPFMLG